jgi:hypothetical protein
MGRRFAMSRATSAIVRSWSGVSVNGNDSVSSRCQIVSAS